MLLTEEEAKTKWCPQMRQPQFVMTTIQGASPVVVGGSNADQDGMRFPRHNCIASACMAWRWWDAAGPLCSDEGRPLEDAPDPSARRGYCGLAGKPE